MIVAEIALLQSLSQPLVVVAPFTYRTTLGAHTTASYWTTTFGATGDTSATSRIISGFVENPATFYQSVASISACQSIERSFYWDNASQTLYVHLTHTTYPSSNIFSVGIIGGYSDKAVTYLDDTEYLPLLKSVPNISQRADLIAYQKLAYLSGTVEFDNTGGDFDRFINEPLYGNEIRILYIDDDATKRNQATPLASFFIEDYAFSLTKFSVRVQDKRKAEKQNVLTTTAVLGELVPLVYGQVRVLKALPNVTEGSTGTVTFRAAVVLTALGTVQTWNDTTKAWDNKTPTATDLANGSFTLSQEDGRQGGASAGTPVTCRLLEPTGIANTTATDVIKDLNSRIAGIAYNDTFYDTAEWGSESTGIGAVAVAFKDQMELAEAIRIVQAGADTRFRYEIDVDGRRTIRKDDWSRASTMLVWLTDEAGQPILTEDGDRILATTTRPTITTIDLKDSKSLDIDTDSAVYYSSITVAYDKDFNEGKFYRVYNTTYEQSAFDKYRQKRTLELETILPTQAQANTIATTYASRLSEIRPVLTATFHGKEYYDVRIYDILNIDLGTTNRTYFGTWKAQVIGVDPKFDGLSNRLTLLLVERN